MVSHLRWPDNYKMEMFICLLSLRLGTAALLGLRTSCVVMLVVLALSILWGLGWYGNSTAYSSSRLICSTRAGLNSLGFTRPGSGNCCTYGLEL